MSNVKSIVVDQEVIDETVHLEPTDSATIRRRSTELGHRHGRALGNAGVAVVGYTTGFAGGFMSAFETK